MIDALCVSNSARNSSDIAARGARKLSIPCDAQRWIPSLRVRAMSSSAVVTSLPDHRLRNVIRQRFHPVQIDVLVAYPHAVALLWIRILKGHHSKSVCFHELGDVGEQALSSKSDRVLALDH